MSQNGATGNAISGVMGLFGTVYVSALVFVSVCGLDSLLLINYFFLLYYTRTPTYLRFNIFMFFHFAAKKNGINPAVTRPCLA
jgi:hypothetical protein